MRIKRRIALLLALCLMLCSCAVRPEPHLLFDGTSKVSAPESKTESEAESEAGFEAEWREDAAGSAKKLLGDCTVVSVFVDDSQTAWSDAERESVWKLCARVERYLENQAKHYDVALNLHTGEEYTLSCVYPDAVSTEITDFSWTTRAQELASYRTFCEEKRLNNVLFLLFVKKDGRSYSLPYENGMSEEYAYENVIIYADDLSDPYLPATLAHETLHPFDADDLYFPYDTDTSRAEIAEELFPDDLMLRLDMSLNSLNIGAYTAYKVGWTDTLEPDYTVFLEKGDSEVLQR